MSVIPVYYDIAKDQNGINIAVTEKHYYDSNFCLDNGSGNYFGAIKDAMLEYGAKETGSSVFHLDNNICIKALIINMQNKGFDMIHNPTIRYTSNNPTPEAQPVKPNISVYYDDFDDGTGTIYIMTTEKNYWDTNETIDIGHTRTGKSKYFDIIEQAMINAGAYKVDASTFRPHTNVSVQTIIANMQKQGFNMIPDKYEFCEYCEESFEL